MLGGIFNEYFLQTSNISNPMYYVLYEYISGATDSQAGKGTFWLCQNTKRREVITLYCKGANHAWTKVHITKVLINLAPFPLLVRKVV